MTTIQAVFFGVMLALTPSVVLLAFLLWREGIGVREVDANLEFGDQPPYPNIQWKRCLDPHEQAKENNIAA